MALTIEEDASVIPFAARTTDASFNVGSSIFIDFPILAPFAPHIAEEMYHLLGNTGTVCDAQWPQFNEEYLKESSVNYPVSFNGKVRFTLQLPADTSREEVERTALANEQTQKYLEGKSPKKVIVVPGKIVNIVV